MSDCKLQNCVHCQGRTSQLIVVAEVSDHSHLSPTQPLGLGGLAQSLDVSDPGDV